MQAALVAIANPRRRAILRLVWKQELSAGEIASNFDVSWPAVSQNLRILRDAGLVKERRDGNRRLYRADHRALGPLAKAVQSMWEEDLAQLKRIVESDRRRAR